MMAKREIIVKVFDAVLTSSSLAPCHLVQDDLRILRRKDEFSA